jgi:hypothetical protein
MSIYRTYFDKDTVIVRNSCVNTGRNPIAELFHGGSLESNNILYSRYIFGFDLSELVDRVNNNEYFLSGMTHKIHITNTSCFDSQLSCKTFSSSCGEAGRATAFDMILFEIPETWAEGNGYDYIHSDQIIQYNKQTRVFADIRDQAYCEGPANWDDRLSATEWAQPGIYIDPYNWYSGNTSGYTGTTINLVRGEQFFEKGNENLCIDVTDYINNLIISGITEANLGIAFKPPLESTPQEPLCYIGFFTRDTQTVYEPFMETIYDDLIKDDRCEFHLDKVNRLYLYVNAGGERVNASISGVTIYDQNDNIYQTYDSTEIKQITTGVYYIDVTVSSNPVSGYCGNIQFRDVWENVTINGNNIGDVELDFIINDGDSYYNVGSGDKSGRGVGNSRNISIYDYHFSFSGIKRKEKIKRGDTRRVDIEAKIPFTCDKKPLDKISYRIYIKEGEVQIEYVPWTEVNRTEDSNYFLIDTSWFIPNDYYMEFKIESGNELRTYHDIIQFEIVSEKDWC